MTTNKKIIIKKPLIKAKESKKNYTSTDRKLNNIEKIKI